MQAHSSYVGFIEKGDDTILKTDFIDVLSIISKKLYESASNVMDTASRMMPANTFCIANLDSQSTKVIKVFNRSKIMLGEGLVVDNNESYCALVTEHAQGPLIIDNNLTHTRYGYSGKIRWCGLGFIHL